MKTSKAILLTTRQPLIVVRSVVEIQGKTTPHPLIIVLPICLTHGLALLSHYFKSITYVCSVIFSLQRRCMVCYVAISDPRCFLPVTAYSTTPCLSCKLNVRNSSKCVILIPRSSFCSFGSPISFVLDESHWHTSMRKSLHLCSLCLHQWRVTLPLTVWSLGVAVLFQIAPSWKWCPVWAPLWPIRRPCTPHQPGKSQLPCNQHWPCTAHVIHTTNQANRTCTARPTHTTYITLNRHTTVH